MLADEQRRLLGLIAATRAANLSGAEELGMSVFEGFRRVGFRV